MITPTAARFIACHSVLHLDASHPLARKAILDPQIMHRLVMSGFYGWTEPQESDPRALMGILNTWTLDLRAGKLVLIVQSRVQPDWSRIPTPALTEAPLTLAIDTTITHGARYTFRTVLNPARERDALKDTPQGPQRIHTRLADTTPGHVRDWFAERLQPDGVAQTSERGVRRIGADGDPHAMAVKILPKLSFTDRHKGKKLVQAEIKGTLTVTDPVTFAHALTHGIGRSRAYSSGLILIRAFEQERTKARTIPAQAGDTAEQPV